MPLLKAYVIDSKENVQKIRKSGKSSRQSLVIFHILFLIVLSFTPDAVD